MAVDLFFEEHATCLQIADDVAIGVFAETAREIGHFIGKGAVGLQQLEETHALLLADAEVVFAEGRREVNQTGTTIE